MANTSSDEVSRALTRIRSGELDERQLIATYRNVAHSQRVSEAQREELVQLIETQLRTRFPRSARTIFGAKDADAREFLTKLLEPVDALHREGNTTGTGVKTGGHQFDGTRYVNVYVSYKNPVGEGVSIDFNQDSAKESPYLMTIHYRVVGGKREEFRSQQWPLANKDDALADFLARLDGLATGRAR